MTTIAKRLVLLRQQMQHYQLDYYLIPGTDRHQNEYVPDCWQRRAFISGFTGSYGDVIISKDHGYLWTDGRYSLQAKQQLDTKDFTVHIVSCQDTTMNAWLSHRSASFRLGTDPDVISMKTANELQTICDTQSAILVPTPNLVDLIWNDQPLFPPHSAYPLDNRFSGQSAREKLHTLRTILKQNDTASIVINHLGEIAWLLNIRGQDIAHTPWVIAQLFVDMEQATLFIDPQKVTPQFSEYCDSQEISLSPPTAWTTMLEQSKEPVWQDPNSTPFAFNTALRDKRIYEHPSPISALKSIKNLTEQKGIAHAHQLDALACIRFLHWLEHHWQQGVNEHTAAKKLDQFRRQTPECVDLSFPTISGFGPNGAIIHYQADPKNAAIITDQSLYLVDSGGQYHNGTTDITRTIHLGTPSALEKNHYTWVLKAHLALSNAIFPAGTNGYQLDAITRAALWQHQCDYNHGTGHGVGHFSSVHETPPFIAKRPGPSLEPGMVVSNEPGLYIENLYGIRIENLCLVAPASADTSISGHGPFYRLNTLTLVPYCRRLICVDALSTQEISTINQYHQRILTTLTPLIDDPQLLHWLTTATQAL